MANSKREVSVELVKIIAIFLVVLCHCTQTFRNDPNLLTEYSEIFANYRNSFSVIDSFFMFVFRTFGHLGNCIFAVASTWYLSEKSNTKNNRVFQFIIDTFVISIIYLIIHVAIYGDSTAPYLIRNIFPNSYANNWYVTGYAMLYMLHHPLNMMCENVEKKTLLKMSIIIFFLYYVVNFLSGQEFYYMNNFLMLIVIYILVSYIKKYNRPFCDNQRTQIKMLLMSLAVFGILLFAKFFFIDTSFELYMLNNPLLLFIGFSLFNVFRNMHMEDKTGLILKTSSMTMLIYLFHENMLFRNLGRVDMVKYIYDNFGTSLLTVKVLIFTIIIFIASLLLSLIYTYTIAKITSRLADYLTVKFNSFINKIDKAI